MFCEQKIMTCMKIRSKEDIFYSNRIEGNGVSVVELMQIITSELFYGVESDLCDSLRRRVSAHCQLTLFTSNCSALGHCIKVLGVAAPVASRRGGWSECHQEALVLPAHRLDSARIW